MKFINKLDRKFGKYAIHNLMYYIILINIVGIAINLLAPGVYGQFLSLDVYAILHGQIWRLVTWIIMPPSNTNILFLAIELYLYYSIGNNLENSWGTFRFNLYYVSGILFNIVAAFLMYFILGYNISLGLVYINRALFLAFAVMYPEIQFLLMFIIPIKVKYLGILYAVMMGFDILKCFTSPSAMGKAMGIAIIVSLANFFIFFFATRNYKKISPKEYKRKKNYRKQVRNATGITRHKCAVCGRTELDDDDLEFRFCSRCDGNYEYCMEHLFTHEHVHKH